MATTYKRRVVFNLECSVRVCCACDTQLDGNGVIQTLCICVKARQLMRLFKYFTYEHYSLLWIIHLWSTHTCTCMCTLFQFH